MCPETLVLQDRRAMTVLRAHKANLALLGHRVFKEKLAQLVLKEN